MTLKKFDLSRNESKFACLQAGGHTMPMNPNSMPLERGWESALLGFVQPTGSTGGVDYSCANWAEYSRE